MTGDLKRSDETTGDQIGLDEINFNHMISYEITEIKQHKMRSHEDRGGQIRSDDIRGDKIIWDHIRSDEITYDHII